MSFGRSRLPTTAFLAANLLAAAGFAAGTSVSAVLHLPEKGALELRLTESLQVTATPVAPGAPVSSGEALLVLDTRPLYRELEQKQEELAQLQANERENPTVGGSTRGGTSEPGNVHGAEMGNLAGEIGSLIGRLKNVDVLAPEDGYLVRRFYEVGAKARRRKPGAVFAPLAATVVEVDLPAAEAARYAVGSRVRLADGADGGRSFSGAVVTVSPAGETVRLALRPLDLPFLLAGVPVEVELTPALTPKN